MTKNYILAVVCLLLITTSMAAGKKGIGQPTGGFLTKGKNGSVVEIYNNQSLCPAAAIEGTALMFRKLLFCPVNVFNVPAPEGVTPTNVAARVIVVDVDSAPALLSAPEEGWAQVNVRKLFMDTPDDIKLRQRTIKEIWRGLGLALGCANSTTQPCVMSEVRSLADLDSIPRVMGPESQGKVESTARRRGVIPTKYVSYRQACQEGWAPAPTNEVQQTIWKEMRQLPTKPLTIEYDPKRGK